MLGPWDADGDLGAEDIRYGTRMHQVCIHVKNGDDINFFGLRGRVGVTNSGGG
jgi:hypothetical protein